MAKIYAPPKELPVPQFDYKDFKWDEWQKTENEYIEKVKAYCVAYGNGAERGALISFGVADGKALYVVFSMSPVVLIHLPLGDAWQYRGIEHFSAQGIREEVRRAKAWDEVWTKHDAKTSKQ
jgi:hypothetical protein